MMIKQATIILAAGKGTRMISEQAKVLTPLCGQPLIKYPLELAKKTGSSKTVVVVGHQRQVVEKEVLKLYPEAVFVHQKEQLGTGHAVATAMAELEDFEGSVLILSGDVPLLSCESIDKLANAYAQSMENLAFLTFLAEDPANYGRVIFKDNKPVCIREYKDCTMEQKQIREVNAGIYMASASFLREGLKKISSDNAQGEFYLTDLVEQASSENKIASARVEEQEVSGINDRVDLARVEDVLSLKINQKYMLEGATIHKPATVYIEATCEVGPDTEVWPGVSLVGNTVIGKNCVIEQGVVIKNSIVKDNAVILAYSVLEDALVEEEAQVGPMARLRPGAVLRKKAKVGNWVELKKVILGEGSKANHLSYLGDGVIGKNVNIGAGCIFCNYDGHNKHQTIIEDNVFIGSDSQLIAPVTIEKDAYVASGTTVTARVPGGSMAISRGRQSNKDGFALELKKRNEELKKAREKKQG